MCNYLITLVTATELTSASATEAESEIQKVNSLQKSSAARSNPNKEGQIHKRETTFHLLSELMHQNKEHLFEESIKETHERINIFYPMTLN